MFPRELLLHRLWVYTRETAYSVAGFQSAQLFLHRFSLLRNYAVSEIWPVRRNCWCNVPELLFVRACVRIDGIEFPSENKKKTNNKRLYGTLVSHKGPSHEKTKTKKKKDSSIKWNTYKHRQESAGAIEQQRGGGTRVVVVIRYPAPIRPQYIILYGSGWGALGEFNGYESRETALLFYPWQKKKQTGGGKDETAKISPRKTEKQNRSPLPVYCQCTSDRDPEIGFPSTSPPHVWITRVEQRDAFGRARNPAPRTAAGHKTRIRITRVGAGTTDERDGPVFIVLLY